MSPYTFAAWAIITLVLALAVGTGSRGKHHECMNYDRVDTLLDFHRTPASARLDSVRRADSIRTEKRKQ